MLRLITFILLVFALESCDSKEPATESQATDEAPSPGLHLSKRFPNALVFDSLNYAYTYSYQLAFDSIPTLILGRFEIVDCWRQDSLYHCLVKAYHRSYFEDFYFELFTVHETAVVSLMGGLNVSGFDAIMQHSVKSKGLLVRVLGSTEVEIGHNPLEPDTTISRISTAILVGTEKPKLFRAKLLAIMDESGLTQFGEGIPD